MTLMNKAAMNMFVHVFWGTSELTSFRNIPKSRTMGHRVGGAFSSLTCSMLDQLTLPPATHVSSNGCPSLPAQDMVNLVVLAILVRVYGVSLWFESAFP